MEGRPGDLLEGHAALDALIRLPRRWLKSPSTVWEVRRALRGLHFDVTFDLQCLTKSSVAAWLSGTKRRIGVGGSDGREFSKWLNNELVRPSAGHVIEHYLAIASPLGIDASPVEFRLSERLADAQPIDSFLASGGLAGRRFAVLNPGAGWPSKLWPVDRYAAVADHLGRQQNMPSVVVWAGPDERAMAETIVAGSGPHARLAPPTSMPQLAALCRRAGLFVGSDTGPMHLAVAVGTPSVSLHGPSRASWCGAYGPRNRALQARFDSSKKRRLADNAAMRAISVDDVCKACDELLAEHEMMKQRA